MCAVARESRLFDGQVYHSQGDGKATERGRLPAAVIWAGLAGAGFKPARTTSCPVRMGFKPVPAVSCLYGRV